MKDQWDPVVYSQNASYQYTLGVRYFSLIRLAADARLLDVGCGDGKLTAYLASTLPGGHVHGIDKSASIRTRQWLTSE